MRKRPNILHIVLPAVVALALSACAPAAAVPAPTQTVSAIYTAAFNTFTAQQATQRAMTPTAAPTRTALPSPAPTTAASNPGVPITGGGGTATAVPSGAGTKAPSCNNSLYINDATIPDGTVITPGTAFTKTWTVKNTGTCQWTTAYRLFFITGEPMGGTSVALPAAVAPGAQTQISVNLTSPALPGNYTGSWQLADAQGNRFGEIITVVIVVSGGTAVPSMTATP